MRRFCRGGSSSSPRRYWDRGRLYEYLQRRYTRVPEGMLIEPSPRYVEETLQDLDLDPTSKGVSTPGSAKDLLAKDAGEKMLDATRAKTYASCVMRLVYLAQDRVDILHTVRLLSKAVSKPTEEAWARLKRLGRYLVGHPRSQTLLRASGHMDVLYAISDSDWATDVESRRSTSCGVLTVDGAVQGVYSRGQTTIAQSSGEAEFYGAASVINEAIGLSGIYAELGIPMIIVLQLDSTAAIGMIQRRGTGRARHMDLRHLFLQERLRDGTIGAIEKIDTSVNLADVGTKHFTASRLEELKRLLGMVDVVARLCARAATYGDVGPSSFHGEHWHFSAASCVGDLLPVWKHRSLWPFLERPAEARIKVREELSGQKFFFFGEKSVCARAA